MKRFLVEISVSLFCSSGLLCCFTRVTSYQYSCRKTMYDSSCSGNTKFFCFFCKAKFKTRILFQLGLAREIFKDIDKGKPTRMFSLTCNLLKMDAYSDGFLKKFLVKNHWVCQIRSNHIFASVNVMNRFNF